MFKEHFNLMYLPFERNIPCESLLSTRTHDELNSRLLISAKERKFCVVTGDVGVGKTTAIRRFTASLDKNNFRLVYISDSDLTPRVFYWEILKEFLGTDKPPLYRASGKHKMIQALEAILSNKQTPVVIVDEAHLLSHEMLQETRFLLNYKMDSQNPMALIIVGQSELRTKLSKEIYEPIVQRINWHYRLPALDRAGTQDYIASHMRYAGATGQIFQDSAISAIFDYSKGCARKINQVCTLSLIAAAQRNARAIDAEFAAFVIDQELVW